MISAIVMTTRRMVTFLYPAIRVIRFKPRDRVQLHRGNLNTIG